MLANNQMVKSYVLLTIIVIIATVFRIYELGVVPRGLLPSEINHGNNAHNISVNGIAGYAKSLDTYALIAMPFTTAFGLSAFSIRLPSAISGIMGVLGIYLLNKKIYQGVNQSNSHSIGIISSFLWALSPWNIHLSRIANETNLLITGTIFLAYVLLKIKIGHKIKSLDYKIRSRIKHTILIVSIIVLAFILSNSYRNNTIEQLRTISVIAVLQQYFSNFSAEELFFKSRAVDKIHTVGELGLLHLPDLGIIFVGIVAVAKHVKYRWIIFAWLMVAPIQSIVIPEMSSASPPEMLLPPLILLGSIGAYSCYSRMNNNLSSNRYKIAIIASVCGIYIYSVITYVHVYYVHYNLNNSWEWNEDITRTADYIAQMETSTNKKIIIDGPQSHIEYIKFFNSHAKKTTETKMYQIISEKENIVPDNDDIVAIMGWKGTPEELKDVKEIIMNNSAVGYKVGIWKKDI